MTAFAGPISFVGIAVPHLMKSLFHSAEPLLLIPACFLGGGAFCLMCDLIARTAFAPANAIQAVHEVPGIHILPNCWENAIAAMIAELDKRY